MVIIDLRKTTPEDIRLIQELQASGLSDDMIQKSYNETIRRREEGTFLNELERRAMLGDKPAQRECTEKGIVLPCPRCRSKWTQVRHMGWSEPSAFQTGYRGECVDCHLMTRAHLTKSEALSDWNTRATPPIGRCKDCKYFPYARVETGGFIYCPQSEMQIEDENAFCSSFKPREG